MSMLNFFRSSGWNIDTIIKVWAGIVKSTGVLVQESGRYILIGDGVKESKEGRKMPGVKTLHQESDNSSKGEYIRGQLFGGIGVLAKNATKMYSILLSARLHDGISTIRKWSEGEGYNEESHVVKTISDAAKVATILGSCLLLLDRLYLTRPMLEALEKYPFIKVITKAKSNCTAYFPPPKYKGRGAPHKKGAAVKVADFFTTHANFFVETVLNLYGIDEAVSYFCIDLKWGKGLYQDVRFVLTKTSKGSSILVSTDLTLTPIQIIQLYSRRFKIECSFRELKQVVAGFACHFWSKAMPKLQKFKCNKVNQANLESITDPRKRKNIINATKAIEGFVQLSIIALGLLQLIGLIFGKEINSKSIRFMRTKSNATPSERTVADFMRKTIFSPFHFSVNLPIMQIISAKQFKLNDRISDYEDSCSA